MVYNKETKLAWDRKWFSKWEVWDKDLKQVLQERFKIGCAHVTAKHQEGTPCVALPQRDYCFNIYNVTILTEYLKWDMSGWRYKLKRWMLQKLWVIIKLKRFITINQMEKTNGSKSIYSWHLKCLKSVKYSTFTEVDEKITSRLIYIAEVYNINKFIVNLQKCKKLQHLHLGLYSSWNDLQQYYNCRPWIPQQWLYTFR